MEFQKFQVKHLPSKRMFFVVRTSRADYQEWWCAAKQVVRFYEIQPPDPNFATACFKVVFSRAGPSAAPWQLYDHRLPFG
ncbi:hypothetical protein R5R35_009199 [Gryllus longicercus]|uniref:Uncharacterized protein n=1 Tax=Gryllus longicercus TaxID=2509291 RepID=A0AAN9YW04_9ORTH